MNETGPVELGSDAFNTMPAQRLPPPSSRKGWLAAGLAVVAGATASFLLWTSGQEQAQRAVIAETAQKASAVAAAAAAHDAEQLKATIERLTRENSELLALKQQLSDDVSRLQATQDELQLKMKGEIEAGDVVVVSEGGRLRVDLIDKIVFDSGDATISARGEAVLAKVGAVLAGVDDKVVQVVGHTDDSPPTAKIKEKFPSNWELSTARATNVVRYLEEQAHVKGARLVASGHGQFAPVATNNNPKGRARNRRIEILLVPPQVAQKVP